MTRRHALAIAAMIGATLFWAGNYAFGGTAANSMPLLSLMFMKWATALVPLIVVTHLVERPRWREVLGHWKLLFLLSMLGIIGYGFMLYQSLMTTTGYDASLINSFNPVLIALAAAVFLRERITPLGAAGIVVALVGVLYALYDGDLTLMFTHGFSHGALWMFGVVAVWTAYTIIIRKAPEMPPLTATSIQVAFAVLVMAPFVLATGGVTLPSSTAGAWSLAYIAVFPSIGAYFLYNYGSKHLPPTEAGVFLNLMTPFVAVVAAFQGNPPTVAGILGGALVIVGVVLTSGLKRKDADRNSTVEPVVATPSVEVPAAAVAAERRSA